jgi:hypothetical protein
VKSYNSVRLLFTFVLCFFSFNVSAQEVSPQNSSEKRKKLFIENFPENSPGNLTADTLSKEDSIRVSVPAPASPSDTTIVKKKNKLLDAEVKYNSKDSIRFEVNNKKLFLYDEAKVDYQDISLKSAYIELDLNKKIVFAKGAADSSGIIKGNPVFDDKGQSFESKQMSYNFETKKGLIKDVITKEGDSYVHGKSVKKMDNDELYIKGGKYTTCDNPEPHFHIQSSKLKIIPNNKIISGPAYVAVENVPTPLALPFALFPNKQGQTSGIILPLYGESPRLGFFLTNGGYYMNISEYMDLALTGDIYSKGSWAGGGSTNYKKRYKYQGNFNARYSNIKIGESWLKDYKNDRGENPFFEDNKDFLIQWRHTQDPKARPNSIFSADVNAGTSRYNQLNALSTGSGNFLTNTLQSNVSYSKSWPGKPYNLSVSARHSQNTLARDMTVMLPEAAFTVNRIFPFKRQVQVGSQKWYEKIGVTYSNSTRNELITKDSLFWDRNNINRLRNGMMHNFETSTSYRALKHFTINPRITYVDRWNIQTIEKRYSEESNNFITDTVVGFRRVGEYNASTNVTTILYGMYQFKRGPVQAVRHVLTPSVGFTFRPDFDTRVFGYYGQNGTLASYSPYEIGAFGMPGSGNQGLINFNLINNLEMKVKSPKDSLTGFKKVKIFENISFSANHNIFAEEFKWSMIDVSGRTQLMNHVDLLFNGRFDPYVLNEDSIPVRINRLEILDNKRLGRFTDGRLAVNFSLRSRENRQPLNSSRGTPEDLQRINRNPNAYVDFNIPWNLSTAFVLNYAKPFGEKRITQSLTFHGDFNLTPKWKIGFNSGYDFVMKGLSYTTVDIYRDLHCWEMVFNWIPIGQFKGYSLMVRVKNPLLQDLRLSRRRSWVDMQ